jgi:hypothetical protein
MTPPQLSLFILEALLKYGPTVAREIVALFQKNPPTISDWEQIFAACEKSYDDYVKPTEPTK